MPFSSEDLYICPGCGAEVRVGSSGCPRCTPRRPERRSEHRESTDPDDEFDYDTFIAEEFGHPLKPRGIAWHWWITAIVLLAAFAWMMLGGRW